MPYWGDLLLTPSTSICPEAEELNTLPAFRNAAQHAIGLGL